MAVKGSYVMTPPVLSTHRVIIRFLDEVVGLRLHWIVFSSCNPSLHLFLQQQQQQQQQHTYRDKQTCKPSFCHIHKRMLDKIIQQQQNRQ